jgi:hypothetical protein
LCQSEACVDDGKATEEGCGKGLEDDLEPADEDDEAHFDAEEEKEEGFSHTETKVGSEFKRVEGQVTSDCDSGLGCFSGESRGCCKTRVEDDADLITVAVAELLGRDTLHGCGTCVEDDTV